jgi:hypothetical protein
VLFVTRSLTANRLRNIRGTPEIQGGTTGLKVFLLQNQYLVFLVCRRNLCCYSPDIATFSEEFTLEA